MTAKFSTGGCLAGCYFLMTPSSCVRDYARVQPQRAEAARIEHEESEEGDADG
jgi:hypothetical protein